MLVEIDRFRVDPGDVPRLLELRGPALAEYRAAIPELRQADLVRVAEDIWLDIRIWGREVETIETPLYARMRELMDPPLAHDRGERVHTTGTAWAAGR